MNFRLLIREPALLLDAFESLVVVAVALGLFNLSGDQQRDLIALFIALLALAKGFLTKPFPVTVVPDLGRAALVFFGSVGLTHLTVDQITLVATFLGTLMTLFQRAQITPRFDPVVAQGGAGAGPVAGQAGRSDVAVVGLVIAVVGLLLLLLDALGETVISLPWCIVLIVVGAAVYVFGGRRTRP